MLQRFQGGLIYFSQATGARAVRGAILQEFGRTGFETGRLGFPTTSENALAGGASTHFQGGSIYYSPATGAHTLVGALGTFWAAAGAESGRLGYPSTSEFSGLRGGGAGQHFRNGSVYYSPATGAHAVRGPIRAAWAGHGWEASALGYPTAEEVSVKGGSRQEFQGGSIGHATGTGVSSVTLR